MPLGTFYGLQAKLIKYPASDEEQDSFIDVYDEMVASESCDVTSLDTGRGHMYLDGLVREDDHLTSLMTGGDLVCEASWGVLTLIDDKAVAEYAERLKEVDDTVLEELNHKYQAQFSSPEPARKAGFFSKLFGQTRHNETVALDPSLVNLFNEVKLFFITQAEQKNAVIVRMVF